MLKIVHLVLVCLVLLVNLCITRPAFADRPKLDQNVDYLEITESLDGLLQARNSETLPEGISSPEALQQKITELQYQKYIVESGEGYGICQNNTSQTIAVYGPKAKKSTSTYDNELYLLPAGEETDEDWDCDGVYFPSDANFAGGNLGAAAAVKILDGTDLNITENPGTGAIELNLPPVQVFKAGDANWNIPDLTTADLTRQFPQAPTD